MITIDVARKPVTFMQCDERWEIFAPSWELVSSFKDRWITWKEYVPLYIEEMRQAYKKNSKPFHDMALRLDNVEFVCWCSRDPKNPWCHRFLLREILMKVRECAKDGSF